MPNSAAGALLGDRSICADVAANRIHQFRFGAVEWEVVITAMLCEHRDFVQGRVANVERMTEEHRRTIWELKTDVVPKV